MENALFVIYDIQDDKLRGKLFDACCDYGLRSVQYSVFFGFLGRNRREELFARLSTLLGKKLGNIIMAPLCDLDVERMLVAGSSLSLHQAPILRLV